MSANSVCWGKCVICGQVCDRQPSHKNISPDCCCGDCINIGIQERKARK